MTQNKVKKMADIDKLAQVADFIDDLTDIVEVLMKDDKVSLKDLLNKDLYPELLDLVKWKSFFQDNFDELIEETKDLDAFEIAELYTGLLESLKKAQAALD